jgi:hypothetical protein
MANTWLDNLLAKNGASGDDASDHPPATPPSSGNMPHHTPPSGGAGGGKMHPPARRGVSDSDPKPHLWSIIARIIAFCSIVALVILFVLLLLGYLESRDVYEERSQERALRMKKNEAELSLGIDSVKKKQSPYVPLPLSDIENVQSFQCSLDTSRDPLKACFDAQKVLVVNGVHPYRFPLGYSQVRFDRAVSSVSGGSYAISVFDAASNGFHNCGPLSGNKDDCVKLINNSLGNSAPLRVVVGYGEPLVIK